MRRTRFEYTKCETHALEMDEEFEDGRGEHGNFGDVSDAHAEDESHQATDCAAADSEPGNNISESKKNQVPTSTAEYQSSRNPPSKEVFINDSWTPPEDLESKRWK